MHHGAGQEIFNRPRGMHLRVHMFPSRHLLTIALSLALLPAVWSYSEVTIMAPAVARTSDNQWIGVASYVTVSAEPGDGRIFVDTFPLTEINTQGSARLAAEAAAAVAAVDLSEIDIHVVIRSDSPVIGGPSAGGAMSVAILASLLNRTTDPKVVMTGTINPDGSVGPIGGVLQKAEAAHSVYAERFLVPIGQTVSTKNPSSMETIDVAKYAEENLDLILTEVHDIREAAKWMIGVDIQTPAGGKEIDLEEFNQIMREASQEMVESATELVDKARGEFESATLAFDERDHVKQYLDDSVQKLDDATGARRDGTYYQGASYAFQSKINATYVLYAVQFLRSPKADTAKQLIEEAEQDATSAVESVNETTYSSITAFECYAAAERRANEAQRMVDEAWASYYQSGTTAGILGALWEAAYLKQRAGSALWWASLCERFPGDVEVNGSVLRDVAQEYIGDLQYLIAYAQSLGSGSTDFLNYVAFELEPQVVEESEDGAYSAAILDALRGRSYLNAHLELGPSLASSDEALVELLSEKVDREREYAIGSISASREFGINPIVALSHLESADTLAKKAEDSPPSRAKELLQSALIELKNSRLIAEMSPVISQRLGGTPEDRAPPIIKPFDGDGGVDGMRIEDIALVGGAFLSVGLVVGVLVGRRGRQDRIYGV